MLNVTTVTDIGGIMEKQREDEIYFYRYMHLKDYEGTWKVCETKDYLSNFKKGVRLVLASVEEPRSNHFRFYEVCLMKTGRVYYARITKSKKLEEIPVQ